MKTLFNRPLLWIAASALMLQGGMVLGAPAQDQQPVASFAHSFDWTAHTQELLTDLKGVSESGFENYLDAQVQFWTDWNLEHTPVESFADDDPAVDEEYSGED